MNSDFEVIYLNEQPIEICYAEEIGFICTNSDSITIFNDTIDIPNKKIPWTGVYGCAINENNEIYISDKVLNHVYKMHYCDDFELKTQGQFGTTGSRDVDLNSPHGIALSKNLIFVCDFKNKSLKLLEFNLKLAFSYQLTFSPISIKCSDKTIGICGDKETCFIDLRSLSIEKEYPGYSGRMNFIHPNFYVVSSQSTHIFDDKGNLIETIKMNSNIGQDLENESDGFIFFHKDNCFISSASYHRFLKFKN